MVNAIRTKKPKKTSVIFALILMFAIAFPLVALQQTANAQLNVPYVSTGKATTYAFIGALPNPVGVGQEVLLHVGITQQLASANLGWYGLSVTIERPDGKIDTLSDITTDSTGGTGRVYVPPIAGKYYLQTHFPEQRMPTTVAGGGFNIGGFPANTTMLESYSEKIELIVTEEKIQYYPGIPLPAEYWTRPINAQFREWYSIAGSSWMDNEFNSAPNTPHVLWTKPLTIGGLVGGASGEYSFEHGDAYEGKWQKSMILAGLLIYQDSPGSTTTHPEGGREPNSRLPVRYHCVDLHTGEERWVKTFLDNRTIQYGQTYYWDSYNYHGVFSYLWTVVGSTWTAFDAYTGDWRFTITDVPTGTTVRGSNGEFYRYAVSGGRMTLWNMTALVSLAGSWGSATYGYEYNATSGAYRIATSTGAMGNLVTTGAAARAQRAWALNFSIPTGLPGNVRAVELGERAVGSEMNSTHVTTWAFSLRPGQEGQLMFKKSANLPAGFGTGNVTISWVTTDLASNVGLVWSKEERVHYAFNLLTGDYLWKTEVPQNYLDIYSAGRNIAYNKLYSVGQSGHLYCFDLSNGKLLWTYNATDPYSEFLWGNNWSQDVLFISDGKVYLFHSEHSPVNPLFRGAPALCIDAETGAEVWRVDGLFRKTDWGGGPIIGDSVIALYNSYDQQVYALGKGPSAVTVSATPKFTAYGGDVMFEGTVNDVSPGTKQTAISLRFPNGVPAVSDSSQGEWMKYVYAQFPRPANVLGVEVIINVVDANGNYREVGRTTSSSDGFYSLAWTPDISGEYKVYASFEGSESYYPSHAETVFVAKEDNATPTPTQVSAASMADTYFVPAIAGLFMLIIIVLVLVVLLMLKKRP